MVRARSSVGSSRSSRCRVSRPGPFPPRHEMVSGLFRRARPARNRCCGICLEFALVSRRKTRSCRIGGRALDLRHVIMAYRIGFAVVPRNRDLAPRRCDNLTKVSCGGSPANTVAGFEASGLIASHFVFGVILVRVGSCRVVNSIRPSGSCRQFSTTAAYPACGN
jgi:hypothetical protein